ncbi:MAG: leucine-rich repeat domain-containing protein [Bacteroidota bacterium]
MKKLYSLLALCLFITGNAQIINFPDSKFKERLIYSSPNTGTVRDFSGNYFSLDANHDGQIQVSEALLVKEMNVSGQNGSNMYYNLGGIENFTNMLSLKCCVYTVTNLDVSGLPQLKELDFSGTAITSIDLSNLVNLEILSYANCALPSIDLTTFPNLKSLDWSGNPHLPTPDYSILSNLQILGCSYNQLTSLDTTYLTNLTTLECNDNQITSLNLSSLTNLKKLDCSTNQLTSLDVSTLINLQNLDCYKNQLTALNINGLTQLGNLNCCFNQISSLDMSSQSNFFGLICSDNNLTTLDVSNLIDLQILICDNNQLTSLFIKSMIYEQFGIFNIRFENNPNLQYICADESKLNLVNYLITSYGYTNCHVNSYCSFVPGTTYYTIEGNEKYDFDNNGCSATDIVYPNLKFSINDGTVTGSIIANFSGSYSIPVIAGTHTMTPIIENPTYYSISPTSATVTFPTQTSPFTQDFCITANGIHPDLEVVLLPIGRARPGFDAKYRIIYKNKGTNIQSGSVNLAFDDAVLDLISATPVTTNQAVNSLSWDYINLLPFETREIDLILNVNSPTETPAVNDGDILDYLATITSPETDDTPSDNTSTFHQIVNNSYDPNDKTCLEGTTITPDMVGEYVHYVIRFENTGTFPAENIVVKDMIDLAKFDISTLIPIKGSYEFVTKISDTNKVEFIFENINLPFDDANNDGFVAFKIKTKSSLVLGDTFTNSANIYFDYNFPIVTNTASTTVQTLGKSDFEFAKYFTVYPNPAKDVLNLSTKNGISVNSIGIYNTLGQLVIAIPNAQSVSSIDISNLKTGNYFIKMITDKGNANTKFVKN